MALLTFFLALVGAAQALQFEPQFTDWNLNQNQQATNVLDYSGVWQNHKFNPSPEDWRMPVYSMFLDRFVNGDPSNDNANGTVFEQDVTNTQLRFGGDIQGLVDTLDYIQGMGFKTIYIIGAPMLNLPWEFDSYSPVDLSFLDWHFATIDVWRQAIDEIHSRGMYVIMDNTGPTMSDLIGFDGFLNTSAPFTTAEYEVLYTSDRQYLDFSFGNEHNSTCAYPRFWDESGALSDLTSEFSGCFNSEFDQYGDIEAFGVFPVWQRELAKFASVQDRLREWHDPVREKLQTFLCLQISMLDIDGLRFDKATQITVDALGNISSSVRDCAAKYNKKNFFIAGEITAGNNFGSIYLGRGRQTGQQPKTLADAMNLTSETLTSNLVIRDQGQNALDAAAFHYSIYRFLTRFLGLSGNLEAGFDLPLDLVDSWNEMILTNDMVNPNTGLFDPRHMYGTTNQDNFRWPAITQGIERELLGQYITTLFMPGMPLVFQGQEQAQYVLDSTADNYVFGRQAMTPSPAWQMHGCYQLGSTVFVDWPVDAARTGCEDPKNSMDQRDPSHFFHNFLKAMYAMRQNFPTFQDAWLLQKLANQTFSTILPGSNETATEFGIWSVARATFPGVQGILAENPVWYVYHNQDKETTYNFDCSNNDTAFIAPFDQKTVVKNLFPPYDEITLGSSDIKLGFEGSKKPNGCISTITMQPFEFRLYVPQASWVGPPPMITKFTPGHDSQINSADAKGSVDISFSFSEIMDCDKLTSAITIASTVEGTPGAATIDPKSVKCAVLTSSDTLPYTGVIPSNWTWSGTLTNVADGIHQIIITNATTKSGGASTGAVDKFLLRVGQPNNPVVFLQSANYSQTLLTKEGSQLFVNHSAAGASMWRYSTNWGSTWSNYANYTGGKQQIDELPWTGTSTQSWSGDHVMVQYWSQPLGTAAIIQQGDSTPQHARRLPHIFAMGTFNQFGFDAGLNNEFELTGDGQWEYHFMDEWPSSFQMNLWGIDPDGQPDASFIFGNVDNDTVLDRMPPSSLATNMINFTASPPSPALSYKVVVNDAGLNFQLQPSGNRWLQLLIFCLLAVLPVLGGLLSVWIFMGSFYKIKVNKIGFKKRGPNRFSLLPSTEHIPLKEKTPAEVVAAGGVVKRRTVLIATMEYNIDDWKISIKIGGLGVMAKLMGSALEHQDLIWVVPCVGGIDYPVDQRAEPIFVHILGHEYQIEVQYHRVKNITYVLLDAPIFRKQSKAEPYPPRMDDMDSAIYYSAWNYCIAETMRRFPVDLYHINDYHGAAAPLYLLPDRIIPCALSLHNAEFQGMWPMRTPEESKEVCEVFNLDPQIVKDYVQFGSVFNLLHAGASYLRVHQKGFGAVGVSKKYGDRSYARYPIFWGLSKIGQLPNPDPTDTAEWNPDEENKETTVVIDQEAESKRGDLRRQAQEWAGLEVDPTAELFVFVGRWSLQKGVDLIADIFPQILEKYPKTQLIAVGPVIDLYGKFAALKLEKLMEKYPKRVFSKPEFTALPPYIFSGAEFALIPSRDEPFGLVAVEFGRKGALGVGARVGGLGQMPGFWYTVESTSAAHLLHQFRGAIVSALQTKQKARAQMRAFSAKQRFPVAQWLADLETLQSEAIRLSEKEAKKKKRFSAVSLISLSSTLKPESTRNTRMFDEASFEDDGVTPPASALQSGRNTPGNGRSRASSFMLTVTDADHNRSLSRSHSQPDGQEEPEAGADEPFLPPSAPYAEGGSNPDSRRSSISLAPVADGGGNRNMARDSMQSVDSLAFRMMSEDEPGPPSRDSLAVARSGFYQQQNSTSRLSVVDVVGDRHDYKLQKVDPFFTDSTGEYYKAFESKLSGLTAKNSDTDLCIEDYLKTSEKEWFSRFRDAKLGRSSPRPSISGESNRLSKNRLSAAMSRISIMSRDSDSDENDASFGDLAPGEDERPDEFLLGTGYKPPSGLKKFLQLRIGDWPVYSFLLALGQIIAANSYQIVLLTGTVGETEQRLFIVAGTYGATSALWWLLFRRVKSLYALSLPWFLYGLAFLLIGLSPFVPTSAGRGEIQDAATAIYAAAASSGALFFATNFGDEGGARISIWMFRACLIQGVQQLYIVGLWFWGSIVGKQTASVSTAFGSAAIANSHVPVIVVITVPIAVFLWAIGVILYIGLPDYYRQMPDAIPSFYGSLIRRRIVPWFFLTVVIQNYWLSSPYGRNWLFLFSSQYVAEWQILLIAIGFFTVIWAFLLWVFSIFSKTHPWLVPVFSIGLGAPRWAQMLWGISGIGLFLPWAGSPMAGAIVSRCLWLWLGVLDNIQGVGLGMVLLLTLTRQHVAAALIGAQVLGSITTIVARATSPDAIGPGPVFPDFSAGALPGIANWIFWLALVMQLIIPLGFFKFFRKEQVAKP